MRKGRQQRHCRATAFKIAVLRCTLVVVLVVAQEKSSSNTCHLFPPNRRSELFKGHANFVESITGTKPTTRAQATLCAFNFVAANAPNATEEEKPSLQQLEIATAAEQNAVRFNLTNVSSLFSLNETSTVKNDFVKSYIVEYGFTVSPIGGELNGVPYRAVAIGTNRPAYGHILVYIDHVSTEQALEQDTNNYFSQQVNSRKRRRRRRRRRQLQRQCPNGMIRNRDCLQDVLNEYGVALNQLEAQSQNQTLKLYRQASKLELWRLDEVARVAASCAAAQGSSFAKVPIFDCLFELLSSTLYDRYLLRYEPLVHNLVQAKIILRNQQGILENNRQAEIQRCCVVAAPTDETTRHLEKELSLHKVREKADISKSQASKPFKEPFATKLQVGRRMTPRRGNVPLEVVARSDMMTFPRKLQQGGTPQENDECNLVDFDTHKQEELLGITESLYAILFNFQEGPIPDNPVLVSGYDVNGPTSQRVTGKKQSLSLDITRVALGLDVDSLVRNRKNLPKRVRKFVRRGFAFAAINAFTVPTTTNGSRPLPFAGILLSRRKRKKNRITHLLWPVDFRLYQTPPQSEDCFTRRRKLRLAQDDQDEEEEEEEEEEGNATGSRRQLQDCDLRQRRRVEQDEAQRVLQTAVPQCQGFEEACATAANAHFEGGVVEAFSYEEEELEEVARSHYSLQQDHVQNIAVASIDCLVERGFVNQVELFHCLRDTKAAPIVWNYVAGLTVIENQERIASNVRSSRVQELNLAREEALFQCCLDVAITNAFSQPASPTLAPTTFVAKTDAPVTTPAPTTAAPTTASPTTAMPTTAMPTTAMPTTATPTTMAPTTAVPSTASPTTAMPTTALPTTASPTTAMPITASPTTAAPTTAVPTTAMPTTSSPISTAMPTTLSPTTALPTTAEPTTTISAAPTVPEKSIPSQSSRRQGSPPSQAPTVLSGPTPYLPPSIPKRPSLVGRFPFPKLALLPTISPTTTTTKVPIARPTLSPTTTTTTKTTTFTPPPSITAQDNDNDDKVFYGSMSFNMDGSMSLNVDGSMSLNVGGSMSLNVGVSMSF